MTDAQFLKKLGKKITQLRKSKDISVQNLAEMIDISRMQLYRIEDGENPTSIIVLRRIASKLGTSLSDLVEV